MISLQCLVNNLGRSLALGACRKTSRQALGLILLLLVAFTGCSKGKDTDNGHTRQQNSSPGKTSSSLTLTEPTCNLTIDTSAWTTFSDLGRGAEAGQNISDSEWNGFGSQPVMTLWLESVENPPLGNLLSQWTRLTLESKLTHFELKKLKPNAQMMVKTYRYSFANMDKIDKYLTNYSRNQQGCRMLELANKWLDAEHLDQPLTLYFLPALPEFRIIGNNLLLDTGAAVASPVDQLNREIVALLHRNRQAIPGENPIEVQGAPAITNSLRILCNEGTAAWIGDMAQVYFRSDHPTLGKLNVVPENLFHKGRQVIGIFNRSLPAFVESETQLTARGTDFARSLAGAQAFTKGGYAMAATIVGHLGEPKLIQAQHSAADFLAAYQEAALLNPDPLPIPGQLGVQNYETMPPFPPTVYDWMQELLAAEK